jgi:hypothetical protein
MTRHNALVIDGIIRKALQDVDTVDFESQQELDEFVDVLRGSFKYLIDDLQRKEL